MTESLVGDLCVRRGYFRTPELNESLYLHFLGFQRIENLDAYVGCRALWLENNCIEEIENLEPLVELKALYMQHNMLRSLGASTMRLELLDTLNVSNNIISELSGLGGMPRLTKLLAAGNKIPGSELHHLNRCPKLSVVDLSHNLIGQTAADTVLDVMPKIEGLASLKLDGNDVVRAVPNYRKRLIGTIAALRYLDDYPVFDDERRTANAFAVGGVDGERAARAALKAEEAERQRQQREFFNDFIASAKERHRTAGGPQPTVYEATMMDAVVGQGTTDRPCLPHVECDDDEGSPSPLREGCLAQHNAAGQTGASKSASAQAAPCKSQGELSTLLRRPRVLRSHDEPLSDDDDGVIPSGEDDRGGDDQPLYMPPRECLAEVPTAAQLVASTAADVSVTATTTMSPLATITGTDPPGDMATEDVATTSAAALDENAVRAALAIEPEVVEAIRGLFSDMKAPPSPLVRRRPPQRDVLHADPMAGM